MGPGDGQAGPGMPEEQWILAQLLSFPPPTRTFEDRLRRESINPLSSPRRRGSSKYLITLAFVLGTE
jgi:hypothetical protein